jgi:hypothetical protein
MKKITGNTLSEMLVGLIILGLFLTGAFIVFNFGLKNYGLINTKNETLNQAQIAVARMAKDVISTDISTLVIGTSQEEYMVFETAISPLDDKFKKDTNLPFWQGHILYYTYPRTVGTIDKKLMRKFVPHTGSTMPVEMTGIGSGNYLTNTYNTGEKLVTAARNIYDLDISISNNYIVDIKLVTWKKFTDIKLAYDKDFNKNLVNDTVVIKVSVMPRNTGQ